RQDRDCRDQLGGAREFALVAGLDVLDAADELSARRIGIAMQLQHVAARAGEGRIGAEDHDASLQSDSARKSARVGVLDSDCSAKALPLFQSIAFAGVAKSTKPVIGSW